MSDRRSDEIHVSTGRSRSILFDLGHPAHFHLFKHAIEALRSRGDRVHIVARQKDCLPQLLDRTGWPYTLIPRRRTGLPPLAAEQVKAAREILRIDARDPVDMMLGTSIVVGWAARWTEAASFVFCEDDAAVVPLFTGLAYTPAQFVVTPRALAGEGHGRKHVTYPGYHELAYLHPDRFEPDPGIRDLLGVAPDERYFLVRLVALRAHHDIGEIGLSHGQAREIVERLERYGRVFVSVEGEMPPDIADRRLPTPVHRIADVLAFADMVVGDSQTMTIEAAVLGTPALRCNTFVGRLSVLQELEHRYGLTVGVRPEHFDDLIGHIDRLLSKPDLAEVWVRRRREMLAETVDLTTWALELIDEHAAARQRRDLGLFSSPNPNPTPILPSLAVPEEPAHGLFPSDACQDKYTTRNPVEKALVQNFFSEIRSLVYHDGDGILDVGAGEGDTYQFLPDLPRDHDVVALEIDGACFARMRRIAPDVRPVQGTIYDLPFPDDSFDTVMCLEVLEHLEDPDRGLAELARVSRRWLILSVPWEPTWRLGNLASLRHVGELGNTPGHIQHWSRRGFVRFVEKRARVVDIRRPLPWTMVLARTDLAP